MVDRNHSPNHDGADVESALVNRNNLLQGVDIKYNNEIIQSAGKVGVFWRSTFKTLLITLTSDYQNSLHFAQALQIQVDFLSPHEALILGTVIEALLQKSKVNDALKSAFKNRNVGRQLVQASSILNYFWHLGFQIQNARKFDALGRVMFLDKKVSFPPATENDLSSFFLSIRSILRLILGPGRYITRVVTRGREEFVVDDINAIAQNLAAETTGFEESMRNQFGNYFGRKRIDDFRVENRLVTDESVLRAFFSQPQSVLINNGTFHVLSVLKKHWENVVSNDFGTFSHQRMEQLNVCLSMRLHLPIVLFTLANQRGLCSWDIKNLGEKIKELMKVTAGEDMSKPEKLINDLLEGDFLDKVCGRDEMHVDVLKAWIKSMKKSIDVIKVEKEKVQKYIDLAAEGIDVGTQLALKTVWEVAEDTELVQNIIGFIKLRKAIILVATPNDNQSPSEEWCVEKLGMLTLDDLTELLSMLKKKMHNADQIVMNLKEFMGTGKTQIPIGQHLSDNQATNKIKEQHKYILKDIHSLIKGRDKERDYLCDKALGHLTPRDKRTVIELVMKDKEDSNPAKLLIKRTKTLLRREIRRAALDAQLEELKKLQNPKAKIIEAQKQFMDIELECLQRFSYDAFMEFSDLRQNLMKLQIISQIHCDSLDTARLERLMYVKENMKKLGDGIMLGDEKVTLTLPPQNMSEFVLHQFFIVHYNFQASNIFQFLKWWLEVVHQVF